MKDKKYPHLENIADLLWLSKFTGTKSVIKKESSDTKKEETQKKPNIEDDKVEEKFEDEPNIEETHEDDLEVHTNKEEENSSTSKQKSAKSFQSPKKLALSNYREWEKAFKFINLKKPSKDRFELDEEKTVENIASLKVFDLAFKRVQEKSFQLTIVIDRGETMELWNELIKNFQNMLYTMGVFTRISIYYWNTTHKVPQLCYDRSLKRVLSEKSITTDGQNNLIWVLSDCIAPSWRSGEAFKSIDNWSKISLTSIVQMFPKEMWMGTMLYKGKHTRFSSNTFNALNSQLKSVPQRKKSDEGLKIPIISFDPYALQAWAKVLINAKNNSISGVVLKEFDFEYIETRKREVSVEDRMQRFYSQASPTAQKLAFYMSVLPVDFQVTRILQEEKLKKSNQSHVAEVFLGGLIERIKQKNNINYEFYPKVREELNANISADESFEIMQNISDFVSSHLGIGFDFGALLRDPNGTFEGDVEISSESLAYAKLASRVLKRKGGEFYNIAKKIDIQTKKHLDSNTTKPNKKTSIVQIETSRGHCIGALINYNNEDGYATVITTKHLLYNDVGELLEAKINNGNTFYDIDLNKVDSVESVDLAIFKIRHQSSYGLLNIENEESKIGTVVSILTYNNGREYVYNGEIIYKSTNSYAIRLLDTKGLFRGLVNISLLSGSSVIDTVTNKLIGVVSMLDSQSNVIQVIPIKKLLNRQFSWKPIVANEQKKPYFKKLQKFLDEEEKRGKNILPLKEHWYSSLDSTELSDVKVVILGQDPYPTVNHAHGLAFSVLDEIEPLPKSLVNINEELFSDLNIDNSHTGYLQPWAEQGVLLLNSILTVEEGKSNSHQSQGWEIFTDKIIEVINNQCHNIVFVLWGAYAQKKGKNIDESKHLILKDPNPSPLSAYRGFFGSKPFSKIDKYLDIHEIMPIEWNLNPKIISGELSLKQINYFKYVLKKKKKELQTKRNNIVHSNTNIVEIELQVTNEFNEVSNALEKIENNLYGICEMCEKSINIQRLKIKPFARYCINCREDVENYPSQLTSLNLKLGEDIILSREKELKEIDELLNKNPILLIHGVGGIGKTTIANYYLHSQKDNFHYYGFFRGLESFIFELHEPLTLQQEKEEDAFGEALSKLKKLKGNKLLVFDDVTEIEEKRDKIEKILALKNYGYKILLTSREEIKYITQYCLDSLSVKDAKALFNSIYKVEDEVLLEEVLTYLDGNLLFIGMIAKALKKNKTLTLQKINDKFKNGEFSIIKSEQKEYFNQQFQDEKNKELKVLLQLLALFPAIEIRFEVLQNILNDKKLKIKLQKLVDRGWLTKKEDSYKLHQIIKTFMLEEHFVVYDKVKYILNNIIKYINKVLIINQVNEYIPIIDSLLTLFEEKKDEYITGILGSLGYLPLKGKIFMSLANNDKVHVGNIGQLFVDLGFEIYATHETHKALVEAGVSSRHVLRISEGRPNIDDMIKNDEIVLAINTSIDAENKVDNQTIRQSAFHADVVYFSTIVATRAVALVIKKLRNSKGLTLHNNVTLLNIDMVHIPKGKFLVGKGKNARKVYSNYDFEIGKYPVTFEEYDMYCEDVNVKKIFDRRSWGRGKRPIINVSWYDAVAFCKWLSKKSNHNYRLPTAEEWEYACRSGTTTTWSFGDNEKDLDKYAWYKKNSNDKTHEVGQKKPNPWGLYDMYGNIWEWCETWYNEDKYQVVICGGSWKNSTVNNGSTLSTHRYDDGGFRILRTLS